MEAQTNTAAPRSATAPDAGRREEILKCWVPRGVEWVQLLDEILADRDASWCKPTQNEHGVAAEKKPKSLSIEGELLRHRIEAAKRLQSNRGGKQCSIF